MHKLYHMQQYFQGFGLRILATRRQHRVYLARPNVDLCMFPGLIPLRLYVYVRGLAISCPSIHRAWFTLMDRPWCPTPSPVSSFGNGSRPGPQAGKFPGPLPCLYLALDSFLASFPSSLVLAVIRMVPSLVPACLHSWLVRSHPLRPSSHLRIPNVAASAGAPARVVGPLGCSSHAPDDARSRAAPWPVPNTGSPTRPDARLSPRFRPGRFARSKGPTSSNRKGKGSGIDRGEEGTWPGHAAPTVPVPARWQAGIGRVVWVQALGPVGRGVA